MKYLKPIPAILLFGVSCVLIYSCNSSRDSAKVNLDVNTKPAEKISDYGFFKKVSDFSKPNPGVIPYERINSMFNDYSLRDDFIYIPDGKSFYVDSSNFLSFPVGSCLINIVYYLKNERNRQHNKQLIETQLLVLKENGWEARDYIWNDDQSDALYSVTGDIKSITCKANTGAEMQIDFVIPGKNECKSCHWRADHISPIGVNVANLNRDAEYGAGKKNQLEHWVEAGLLKNFTIANASKYPDWKDTKVAIEQRVRSYLDANCAHCHNPDGPAYVSGLFLNHDNYNMAVYGICKSPPSAGKGSCNLKYDIVPGKPAESIIVCRMAATELGIKMPQLGRTVIDNDGVALIIQWIAQLKGDCSVQ